ncbi:MAG: bifunctional 23S rRNA (guanine(2069)-N(7))-methyltransferase RlmK/23S rRNA (guanine(2445)-N(2))-methyltransferase RlmL [Planctomycetota bacterium]
MGKLDLIATATFGLEAVVARELNELGYETRIVSNGRIAFAGEPAAIARSNLWLRSADRVVLQVGQFEAMDFGQLFDRTHALPWEQWIPADGAFPVNGRSRKSQLSSVPACQRIVKKAIVEKLRAAHGKQTLPESGPQFTVEVALLEDVATLTLDTTGRGLNKRGYRPIVGKAPLKETLAAALVQLSFWRPERPLVDPFCGTGTIPIEAALIGRNMAPGLNRQFAAEDWPAISDEVWQRARAEARDAQKPSLPVRILGYDLDERALGLARRNAEAAGVAEDIHFQHRPFVELSSPHEYGCVITNPPYGWRMSEQREVEELYRTFPMVLRRLPTWSHFVLTADKGFEKRVGRKADRRRKLYNGRVEVTYYQFHGPKPGEHVARPDDVARELAGDAAAERDDKAQAAPAFGGVTRKDREQAEVFRNRLAKRAHHLRRWPKRGITCYRLYDRDIPEVPLAVDCYEDRLHIAEYERPHDRSPARHGDWLELMARTAGEVLEIPPGEVYLKRRERQKGAAQYERLAQQGRTAVVNEGGLKFLVNLSDYVDTGLFLDHRNTRAMIRDEAAGQRFLNLFAYTGSFTVYAADGGAKSMTTVDLSSTYIDWARENMELNGFTGAVHRFERRDALTFLAESEGLTWDLAVADPPTFSNSKALERDWDVQRDHVELLNLLLARMSPGGVVYFSTNFRKFKLDQPAIEGAAEIREITNQTIPEDFRNKRIHRCWRIVRAE